MRVLILTRKDLKSDAPANVAEVRFVHFDHWMSSVQKADVVAVYNCDDRVKVLKSRFTAFDKSPTMSYFDFCRFLRDEAREYGGC
jgi:hypothetical protein